MKPKKRYRRRKEANNENKPFFQAPNHVADSGQSFFNSSPHQAKLMIGKANDPFEKQADATAHAAVHNTGNNTITEGAQQVQRKEKLIQKAEEEEPQAKLQKQAEEEEMQTKLQKQEEEEARAKLQRQAEAEEEEVQTKLQKQEEEEMQTKLQKQEEEEVQARAEVFRKEDADTSTVSMESRVSQAKSGGQVLPDDVRLEMEEKLGASFKQVRIHDDGEAHALCKELNALAFAIGHHIFFKKGQYQPYTQEGKFLLAHELTHVLQQRSKKF
jgi:hypothetical protein